MVARNGGDSGSTVIKLDTVRKIAEKVSKPEVETITYLVTFSDNLNLISFVFFSLSSLRPGQAPSAGHHSHCSGEAELHPVPPNGAVLGPSQPQRCQGHEAEVQPQL